MRNAKVNQLENVNHFTNKKKVFVTNGNRKMLSNMPFSIKYILHSNVSLK